MVCVGEKIVLPWKTMHANIPLFGMISFHVYRVGLQLCKLIAIQNNSCCRHVNPVAQFQVTSLATVGKVSFAFHLYIHFSLLLFYNYVCCLDPLLNRW